MNPNKDTNNLQDTYQTGSTCPPKSYGGAVAFLMVLVIILCGISTALGLMNIRLLNAVSNLAQQETVAPVAFSNIPEQAAEADAGEQSFSIGIWGQEVPEIWCLYQNLPRGIYITAVEPHSEAAEKGILPGDILLQVDGETVTTTEQLHGRLEQAENTAALILYRDGKQIKMTIRP